MYPTCRMYIPCLYGYFLNLTVKVETRRFQTPESRPKIMRQPSTADKKSYRPRVKLSQCRRKYPYGQSMNCFVIVDILVLEIHRAFWLKSNLVRLAIRLQCLSWQFKDRLWIRCEDCPFWILYLITQPIISVNFIPVHIWWVDFFKFCKLVRCHYIRYLAKSVSSWV